MKKKERRCPSCGSANLLPSENGNGDKNEYSLQIILYAAFFVFIGALSLLLVTLVISFPLVVMAAIALIGRLSRRKKKKRKIPLSWICLDCDRTSGNSAKKNGCIPGRRLPL